MEAPDGLPVPQRYWAMLTVALALIMAVLDGAIANVALPTIAADVQASPASSIWVVNAYQLVITISLLPMASLGEHYGYRRVYQVGLAVFTIGSLACALSSSLTTLTLARVVQGFGAAGIMSVNGALVRYIYPRHQLGRGIGLNALLVGVSSAVGPTVAAGILSVASWPWLFAVNVPIGLAAFAIAARSLPVNPLSGQRFDMLSALLNALTFGLLITGIDGLGQGESGGLEIIQLVLAALIGVALVRRQLSLPSPLLPVDLLRIPVFRLSILTSICSFGAQMLAYVSMPFYLQNALGRSEVTTGLLMTPWPLMTAVIAPLAGRLADRYPSGMLGGIGLGAMAIGLGLLATLSAHPSDFDIAWRMAICGLGFGLFQSPNNRTLLSSAPRERSGGASGMLATARLIGQTIGAAVVALLFGLYPANSIPLAIGLATAIAAVAALLSLLRVKHQ
ncbi:MFS transporter, DHA2 family, multidrug resistance protein [Enhydrobacter aerosaccus]|uniref:MFS transporter, DHA2 family, multidrug resistance protein n=1 Tax=Enhydrobacter aerosaccus TaxID=225324 RepID=A0A1T4T356_9HYPH|nr:MFS transporter [Enhydrobacter aerosaccus]SKA34827.1 MFS transporter, DHA2 family, multidrug resistance protein [Enhydrobacter aerosaccus]